MAEMVYGSTLRLPNELVTPSSPAAAPDSSVFVQRLSASMSSIRPSPGRARQSKAVFQAPELQHCTHLFVHHDALRRPLQPTYDGPFRVLQRSDKYYRLQLHGREDSVSIDRLKPAFLDEEPDPEPTPHTSSSTSSPDATAAHQTLEPPPVKTRSGRTSRKTVRFSV